MKLACAVQGRAHMAKKKSGRGSRGGGEVVDITPLLLKEIRDGFRDLSGRVDGLSGRVDGLTGQVDGLNARMDRVERELVTLRQDVHQEISGLRISMDHRFDLLDRRVRALEDRVGALEDRVGALESAVFSVRH